MAMGYTVPFPISGGGSSPPDVDLYKHGYEKGIIDYINGCVDEKIVDKEKLRKLKINKL